MNIEIKSIGYKVGTIGYLKSALESGTLELEEGTLKSNGNHGLWLKGERQEFLGAFNRFSLTLRDFCKTAYEPVADVELDAVWTDCAREKLIEIAQKWCDEQNEIRAKDCA